MSDYHQPDFYRFNEDSIKLVKWIAKKKPTAESILDLGAGSGVIGIELANQLKPTSLDLLEVQPEYLHYLQQNISQKLSPVTRAEIFISSFGEWIPPRQYDLIVCNPPYYLPNSGEPSKDHRRNIARSFVIDNWEVLLSRIEESLKPSGRAFLVLREDPKLMLEIKSTALDIKILRDEKLLFVELSRLDVDGSQDSF